MKHSKLECQFAKTISVGGKDGWGHADRRKMSSHVYSRQDTQGAQKLIRYVRLFCMLACGNEFWAGNYFVECSTRFFCLSRFFGRFFFTQDECRETRDTTYFSSIARVVEDEPSGACFPTKILHRQRFVYCLPIGLPGLSSPFERDMSLLSVFKRNLGRQTRSRLIAFSCFKMGLHCQELRRFGILYGEIPFLHAIRACWNLMVLCLKYNTN